MVHAGPTHGTICAAVERSPAGVADLAAVVVAAGQGAGQGSAVDAGVLAQALRANPTGWAGSVAVERATAAVADLCTDDGIVGITGVGFAHRRWCHAHVVYTFPAGVRAGSAVHGSATAVADASAVLATFVLADHRRAGRRRAYADSRAVALPANGAVATFQCPTTAVADPPAVPGSLPLACPIRHADADRVGQPVKGAVMGGVRRHGPIAAVRREDHVASISDCVADPARTRIFAPDRSGAQWRTAGGPARGDGRQHAQYAPSLPARGLAGTRSCLHARTPIIVLSRASRQMWIAAVAFARFVPNNHKPCWLAAPIT